MLGRRLVTAAALVVALTACSHDPDEAAAGPTPTPSPSSSPTTTASPSPPTAPAPSASERVRDGLRTLARADKAAFLVTTHLREATIERRGQFRPSSKSYVEYIQDTRGGQQLQFQVDRGVEYFRVSNADPAWRCFVPVAGTDSMHVLDQAFLGTGSGRPRALEVLTGLRGRSERSSTTVIATAPLVDVLGLLSGDLYQGAGIDDDDARVSGIATFGRSYELDAEALRGFEVNAYDLKSAITQAGGMVPPTIAALDYAEVTVRISLSDVGEAYRTAAITADQIIRVSPDADEHDVVEAATTC